jgi:hypothetical protein
MAEPGSRTHPASSAAAVFRNSATAAATRPRPLLSPPFEASATTTIPTDTATAMIGPANKRANRPRDTVKLLVMTSYRLPNPAHGPGSTYESCSGDVIRASPDLWNLRGGGIFALHRSVHA